MKVKERILSFCEIRGIKKKDLAKYTEIAATNFAKSAMKSDINCQPIVRFLEKFPEISAEWLMRGEGSMLKSERQNGSTLTQNIQGDGNNASISTVNASPNASQPPSVGCDPDICSLMKAKDAMIQAKIDLISAKDDMIRAKDEVIAAQRTTIATLQKALDSLR